MTGTLHGGRLLMPSGHEKAIMAHEQKDDPHSQYWDDIRGVQKVQDLVVGEADENANTLAKLARALSVTLIHSVEVNSPVAAIDFTVLPDVYKFFELEIVDLMPAAVPTNGEVLLQLGVDGVWALGNLYSSAIHYNNISSGIANTAAYGYTARAHFVLTNGINTIASKATKKICIPRGRMDQFQVMWDAVNWNSITSYRNVGGGTYHGSLGSKLTGLRLTFNGAQIGYATRIRLWGIK